jgi:hypothetical protein
MGVDKEGHCHKLRKKIKLTNPISWQNIYSYWSGMDVRHHLYHNSCWLALFDDSFGLSI